MSDHQNENASRIAAYLENKLSPEEREAFKRRLSEDDELRLQYVDALMNRAGTGSSGGEVMPEPEVEVAPEPVAEVTPELEAEVTAQPEAEVTPEPLVKAVSAPDDGEAPGPEDEEGVLREEGARRRVGFMGSGWIVAITLLLLIIAGVVMFLISRHQDSWDNTVAAMAADSGVEKKGTRIDSVAEQASTQPVATPPSPVGTAGKGGGAGTVGDSLFMNFYRPYARGDDPIELNQYYRDYRT